MLSADKYGESHVPLCHPGGRSLPMLDTEARMLLDLMDKAVQEGTPKPNTLPYIVGRAAVDKMLEDSEADPPEVAAIEVALPDRLARSAIGAIGRWAYQAGHCRR
jgi:hypothetical protein